MAPVRLDRRHLHPPFTVVELMGDRVESSKLTFKIFMGLMPALSAVKSTIASVPLPLTPGIGPIRLSALKLMVAKVLSMVPGTKKVDPPPGKNDPSVTEMAERESRR
jgi:hypothetical protein